MRIHSGEKIEKLIALRQKGYSIQELMESLQMPKTTVWHHVQNVKILPEYLALLKSKRGGSRKRKDIKIIEARSKSLELLSGKDRESILMFSMLYWAEGTKKAFQFINSDGRMIALWLDIVRNIIKIKDSEIRPILRIYTGMNKESCLRYWSKVTKFPKSKFIIRLNDGGKSGKVKYGMCRIEVKKSSNLLKLVLASIDQICIERNIQMSS